MDETTFALGGRRARYGWGRKGIPRTMPVTLSRKKKHVFGVLSQDDLYLMIRDT